MSSLVGMVFLFLFWNGIVSVFVFFILGVTLHHFDFYIPEWLPALEGNYNDISLHMIMFLWVFLTPFIMVGGVIGYSLLDSLFGKILIYLGDKEFKIKKSVLNFGSWKFVEIDNLVNVKLIDVKKNSDSDVVEREIALIFKNGDEYRFGKSLRDNQREFLFYLIGEKYLNLQLSNGPMIQAS